MNTVELAEIKNAGSYSFPYIYIGPGNIVTVISRHTLNAMHRTCNQGHTFMVFEDHPKHQGNDRCPYCLAIGYDMQAIEIMELKRTIIRMKNKR